MLMRMTGRLLYTPEGGEGGGTLPKTQEELDAYAQKVADQRVTQALEKRDREAAARIKEEREKADKEAERRQKEAEGKHQEIAEQERQAREKAEKQLTDMRTRLDISAYLTGLGAGHLLPFIAPDGLPLDALDKLKPKADELVKRWKDGVDAEVSAKLKLDPPKPTGGNPAALKPSDFYPSMANK